MVDLFFSEFFFQFVILATKNISADVAEKFLLAVVTRWALPIFLMNCPLEKSCIFFLSRLMFLMFLKTNVFLRLLFLRSLNSISNWYIVIVSLCVWCSYSKLFWSPFSRDKVSLRIQYECEKRRTRITPNTDIFYAVLNC